MTDAVSAPCPSARSRAATLACHDAASCFASGHPRCDHSATKGGRTIGRGHAGAVSGLRWRGGFRSMAPRSRRSSASAGSAPARGPRPRSERSAAPDVPGAGDHRDGACGLFERVTDLQPHESFAVGLVGRSRRRGLATLPARSRRSSVSPPRWRRILRSAADALEPAHSRTPPRPNGPETSQLHQAGPRWARPARPCPRKAPRIARSRVRVGPQAHSRRANR